MAGGFNAPSILFLNTWDAPERAFLLPLFKSYHGKYTTMVEPAAGAFVSPMCAAEAGWTGPEMDTSDVGLYSAVVGAYLAGDDFDALNIQVDGKKVRLPTTPVKAAARILWTQLLLRFEARPARDYWEEMIRDVKERQAEHEKGIADKLKQMHASLGGLTYAPRDLFEHVAAARDNPGAVISMNPPTYKAGFEKFYDTKGRLTWAEPEYEIFDPKTGITRIMEMCEGRPALLIIQQQQEPGHASSPTPVFARHLSPGQYVYILSNRPDEIFDITGGPIVARRVMPVSEPLPNPPLPFDYDITRKSTLEVVPVGATVASYYKDLWIHRLAESSGGANYVVLIDGHVAGIGGYSLDPAMRPFPGLSSNTKGTILMRFAIGAPHNELRLTRLVTKVALQHRTIMATHGGASLLWADTVDRMITSEYTQYPESKGLRGLMKMQSRVDHPDGYKLVYTAPLEYDDYRTVIRWWFDKEAQWRRARAKNSKNQ